MDGATKAPVRRATSSSTCSGWIISAPRGRCGPCSSRAPTGMITTGSARATVANSSEVISATRTRRNRPGAINRSRPAIPKSTLNKVNMLCPNPFRADGLPTAVRVAGLFSGGKDSTYAAYAAVQRGWELTHLLSIFPEDRDSMLFHVPNVHMTALLAEAMQRPLISELARAGEEGELDALRRIVRRVDVDGILVGAKPRRASMWRGRRIRDPRPRWTPLPSTGRNPPGRIGMVRHRGRLAGPRRAPCPQLGTDHRRRRACGTVRRSLKNWDRSSSSAILAPATFASFRQAVRSRALPAIANARATASYAYARGKSPIRLASQISRARCAW